MLSCLVLMPNSRQSIGEYSAFLLHCRLGTGLQSSQGSIQTRSIDVARQDFFIPQMKVAAHVCNPGTMGTL